MGDLRWAKKVGAALWLEQIKVAKLKQSAKVMARWRCPFADLNGIKMSVVAFNLSLWHGEIFTLLTHFTKRVKLR
jgi:hypothetical protein